MVKNLITKAELARRAGVSETATAKAFRGSLNDAVHGKRIDANHPLVVNYMDRTDPRMTNPVSPGLDLRYAEAIAVCNENGRFTVSNIARKLKMGFSRAEKILTMMQAAGMDKPRKVPPPPPPPEIKISKPVATGTVKRNLTKKTAAIENLNALIDQGSMIHEIPKDIKNFAHMTLSELINRFGTDIAFLDWLKATKEIEIINEKRLKNAQTRGELVNRVLIKNGVIEPFDTAFNKLLTDGAKTIARRVSAMTGAGRSVEDCEKFVADQMSSFIKPMKAKISRTLKNA